MTYVHLTWKQLLLTATNCDRVAKCSFLSLSLTKSVKYSLRNSPFSSYLLKEEGLRYLITFCSNGMAEYTGTIVQLIATIWRELYDHSPNLQELREDILTSISIPDSSNKKFQYSIQRSSCYCSTLFLLDPVPYLSIEKWDEGHTYWERTYTVNRVTHLFWV
jgi:hypothetical protein